MSDCSLSGGQAKPGIKPKLFFDFAAIPRIVEIENGRGDRIRTCDPLLPKQMRYQTALLPEPANSAPSSASSHRKG